MDELTKKFPFKFFAGVFAVILLVIFHTRLFYNILPRDTYNDCITQCKGENDKECIDFCECVHKEGNSLEYCLDKFEKNK